MTQGNSPPPSGNISARSLFGESGATLPGNIRQTGGRQKGYSRFVRYMKITLLLLAAGIGGLIIGWPHMGGDMDGFTIGFSTMKIATEEQSGMDNARYTGVDENKKPYSVSADLVRLVDGIEGAVTLDMPKADLTMEDGTWLAITASEGLYDQKKRTLELTGPVNLFHDMGYEINTMSLSVYLASGRVEGRDSVDGHGPFGELDAAGITVDKKSRTMHFTGPARLVLYSFSGGGFLPGENK